MGAIVLKKKRLLKNVDGPFANDRFHYLSNDGQWLKSINSDGEESKVPFTPAVDANESFIWDGGDKAYVEPHANPFDVRILCIVVDA